MFAKKVATNTLFQILTRISTAFIGLLFTLLVAKAFGASGYGDYTKITALVTIFYLVIDFGLNAQFLQLQDTTKNLLNLVLLRFAAGVSVAVLLNSILFLLPLFNLQSAYPLSIRLGILLYSFTFLTQAIILSASAFFQQRGRYDLLFYSTLIGSIVSIAGLVIVLSFPVTLFGILFILVMGPLITASSCLFFLKNLKRFQKVSLSFCKKLLYETLPLGTMLVLNLIYARIDVILLTFFVSSTEVGLYGLSYRFFDFFLTLPLFLSNAVYPLLLKHGKNSRIGKSIASSYLFLYALFGVGIGILCFVIAPFIGLIKSDFMPSIFVFRILIASLPLFFITSFLQWLLIADKRKKYLLFVYATAGIINIILNIIFIPHFGYIAAAVITDICEALVFILLLTYSYWHNIL